MKSSADSRTTALDALRHQQADVADTRSDTLAGLVLECALAIAEPGAIVRPVAIAAEINRRKAEEQNIQVEELKKPMQSFVVGKIMKEVLEFPRAKRDKKGNRYELEKERVAELVRRYGMQSGDDATEQGGIPENPTPPTHPTLPTSLHRHPTPENQQLQLENEENVGGVGSVGSQEMLAGSGETPVLLDHDGDNDDLGTV